MKLENVECEAEENLEIVLDLMIALTNVTLRI
jgi:hypothetical protein